MSSFTFRSREIEIHPYQSGKNWLAEVWLDGECYFPAAPITAAYEMVTRKVIELEGRASFYVVPTAPFVWDDGGRSRSRRSKQINDCTVRAVAIARSLTYDEVYDKLSGLGRECREGFHLHQINPGQWIPFQSIKGFARMYAGPFCKIFGNGRYIIKTAKHVAAVVDGLLHDTSRTDAFRCVYGAWQIRDEDLQNPGQIGSQPYNVGRTRRIQLGH